MTGREENNGVVWINLPLADTAGKLLHAVLPGSNRTLCGLKRSRWNYDFFNTEQCKRCKKTYDRLKVKE